MLTDSLCDVNAPQNYWAGTDRTANVGFVIDLWCSQLVSTIIIRNAYNAHFGDRYTYILCIFKTLLATSLIRGTKEFDVFGSTENDPDGWTLLLSETLADASDFTACNKPLVTFTVGTPAYYRYVKFVAKTYVSSGAALNYLHVG